FIFPAVAAVPVIIAWFVLYLRKARHKEEKKSETQTRSLKEMLQVAKREKLAKYAVVCVFEGMIRDSVVFWAPILIGRIFVKDSSLTLTIIPLSMIVGQIIARTVGTKAKNNFIRSLSLIMLGIVISSVAMILLKNAIVSAIIMGIDIILTQTISSSMTVVVPIAYVKENMTAFVAGFMDASHYLGAAIASFGLGVVLTGDNWEPAVLVWLLTSVAGLIYCLTVLPERRGEKNDGDQDDNRAARQKKFA
ncbi:MAG: MFS transporter, partial [Clostridia bacterium]|nr:MFS transporter [Clostridia bacterium]